MALHTGVSGSPSGCRAIAATLRRATRTVGAARRFLARQRRPASMALSGHTANAYQQASGTLHDDTGATLRDVAKVAAALDTYADDLTVVLGVMRRARQLARTHGFEVVEKQIHYPACPTGPQALAWRALRENVRAAQQADESAKDTLRQALRTHVEHDTRSPASFQPMAMPAHWPPADDDWPAPGFDAPLPEHPDRDRGPDRKPPSSAPTAPTSPSHPAPTNPAPTNPAPTNPAPTNPAPTGPPASGDAGGPAPDHPPRPDHPSGPHPPHRPHPPEVGGVLVGPDGPPDGRGPDTPRAAPEGDVLVALPAEDADLLDPPGPEPAPEPLGVVVTPDGRELVIWPLPAEEAARLDLPIGTWGELT